MNYLWCTIQVSDLEKSIKFYTEIIGLTMESRFSPRPGMEIVFLKDANGVEYELIKPMAPVVPSANENISVGFEVQSLEDALNIMAINEIPVIEGPFATPAVKFFFIKDPDGFKIQIVERTA